MRYLRRLESGPSVTRERYSQSGYASFITSAKPAIPAQKVFETTHPYTNVDAHTWDIATRVIEQNLKQVDIIQDNLRMANEPYPPLSFLS
jgi:hypothetical protein